jgi:hypothetical protein
MELINVACFKVMCEEFSSGGEESIQDLQNRDQKCRGFVK